jgi:hypothetical protein
MVAVCCDKVDVCDVITLFFFVVSFQISSFAECTKLVMKVHFIALCLEMDIVCAVMSCT